MEVLWEMVEAKIRIYVRELTKKCVASKMLENSRTLTGIINFRIYPGPPAPH